MPNGLKRRLPLRNGTFSKVARILWKFPKNSGNLLLDFVWEALNSKV